MARSFVRIAGHGIRLLPSLPFAIRAVGPGLDVVVPDDAGEYVERVDTNTERAAHGFGDVFDGPDGPWILEVGGVYRVTWPTGLDLRSWPEPDKPPFFMLSGEAGSLVYVQGPFAGSSAPALDAMRGEGQRELGRGGAPGHEWIEFGYDHKGVAWRQRHVRAPLSASVIAVVTAQMPAAQSQEISGLATAVADSLTPYRG